MIRILIADDHKLFRDLLSHMLEEIEDLEVVAKAKDGAEAMALAKVHRPDVILMDLDMPLIGGIEALKLLKEDASTSKVIILSAFMDEEQVNLAKSYNAHGYLLKDIGKEELVLAIRSVHSGMEVIHKSKVCLKNVHSPQSIKRLGDKMILTIGGVTVELTERDLQVMHMIVDSKSVEEIAKELFITEGRVRNIITELISKLMLKDRTQLAVFALKNKLV